MDKRKSVIIVAGGRGQRMQTELPKQFLTLRGLPVLMHTILRFHQFDKTMQIVVVLPEDEINYWENLCEKHQFNILHQLAIGGKERFDSVKNGLKAISNADYIAIHDGVRPFVSFETINRCFQQAETSGAAIPVIELVDSIREIEANSSYARDRSKYRLVQTPQVFKFDLLKSSYEQNYAHHFTDDASVVEASGHAVALVEGNRENIKITTAMDFEWAELYAPTNIEF